ncbi:nucleotide exchange factor GrpE [Caldicoprobacter algeriensis]|nr:nucleotide exchange factor GrpE [Caldicoprobacter algeriensis]
MDQAINENGDLKQNVQDAVPSEGDQGDKPLEACNAGGEVEQQQEEGCVQDEQPIPTVESLQQQLEKVMQERDEYLSLAQRIQADFDNYRKRNKNAIAEAYDAATADVVKTFLPVLDNLERALDSAKGSSSHEAIAKGVEMVVRQFKDVLKKLGVEEIDALGKAFDPELHEAVMRAEAEEGVEDNTVVEVFQKGYKYKDRVIRHSMVKVAGKQ